jgi:hypothetical protein
LRRFHLLANVGRGCEIVKESCGGSSHTGNISESEAACKLVERMASYPQVIHNGNTINIYRASPLYKC